MTTHRSTHDHTPTPDPTANHERQSPDGCAASSGAPGWGSDSSETLANRLKTVMSLGLPEERNAVFIDQLVLARILNWYDEGGGSGTHLRETLGVPPSPSVRALANILTCAKQSAEVQRMLAELAV